MRGITRWAWFGGWLLAALSLCSLLEIRTAYAQTPVNVALTPNTLALNATESARVVATIENSSEGEARGVDIVALPDAGVTVDPMSVSIPSIPIGGIVTKTYTITAKADARIDGSIGFVLSAEIGAEGRIRPVASVATITVQERQPPAAEQLISATVVTALSKLTDRATPRLFLQVENISDANVSILEVKGVVPPFLTLCSTLNESESCESPLSVLTLTRAPDTSAPQLEPHEQELYEFFIDRKASASFQTGKQVVVFRVEVSQTQRGTQHSTAVITKHEFDTVVFGESDVLTPLGLTSFFLLPGFLLVLTFVGLWGSIWPKGKWKIPADKTSAEFWIVVVTTSLIAILVYNWLFDRDLFDGYDSNDLFAVWIGAVGFAALTWSVMFGVAALSRLVRSSGEGRHQMGTLRDVDPGDREEGDTEQQPPPRL